MHHNYWAPALESGSCNYWSPCPRACALQQEKPPQSEACAWQLESEPRMVQLQKSLHSNENLAQPIKINFKKRDTQNKREVWPWNTKWSRAKANSFVDYEDYSISSKGFLPTVVDINGHIFLPFHTVHVVLQAWMLEWVSISFSSGPHFVRTLHYDPSILGGPAWHDS